MKNWQRLLKAHDPAAGDGLAPHAANDMRRRVLAASAGSAPPASWWLQPLAIAAMLLLMVAAGVLAGRRLPEPVPHVAANAGATAGSGERRQLHFATPGGTRIIWVFNPEFDSNGTTP